MRESERSGEAEVNIAAWLQRLGLEQYEQAFRENDVDAEVLPELTAEDLIGLGVTSIGQAWGRACSLPPRSDPQHQPTPYAVRGTEFCAGRRGLCCRA